jgi:hypothetical protein
MAGRRPAYFIECLPSAPKLASLYICLQHVLAMRNHDSGRSGSRRFDNPCGVSNP